MAYFLRKHNKKRGIYLQVLFSYRDPESGKPKNKSVISPGYVSDLIDSGIPDPITFYSEYVKNLNDEYRFRKNEEKRRLISERPALRYLGYFPLAALFRKLEVSEQIQPLLITRNFQFPMIGCLLDLICARAVAPCSKLKTAEDVIPCLWDGSSYSYDQVLACVEFFGKYYEKIIEIFTRQTNEYYELDTSSTFFDCTNFYFEIDRMDDLRRKGPSKEHRTDPIVGMGLLLDRNCIPIAMRLYPGNQSEKPVFREVLDDLKRQQNITGRTIRIADKGLNCAQNIYHALSSGDGYIFSKSIKSLSEKEREWALSDRGFADIYGKGNDSQKLRFKIKSGVDEFWYEYTDTNGRKIKFKSNEKRTVTYNPALARKQKAEIQKEVDKARGCCLSQAKKSEYGDSAKYVTFTAADKEGNEISDKVVGRINEKKVQKDLDCAGYNMIVTSEIAIDEMEIYDTYHRLWRIEESFRSVKTQLDARPVFLQKENCIKGHFLICYLTVLLERLFQFKVLDNKFCTEEIYEFIREFRVLPVTKRQAINTMARTPLTDYLENRYKVRVNNYYLSEKDITNMIEKNF